MKYVYYIFIHVAKLIFSPWKFYKTFLANTRLFFPLSISCEELAQKLVSWNSPYLTRKKTSKHDIQSKGDIFLISRIPEKWSPENWSPGNSETKNHGVDVEHHGCVCVWNVGMWSIYEIPKTRQQTQNSETKNRGVSVEHRGVCVECSDVINVWKPKTRQQIFLDSFSVLQFSAYVGSWRKRQTFFCVCSRINW